MRVWARKRLSPPSTTRAGSVASSPRSPLRARYDAHTGRAHGARSGGRADDADDDLSDPITLITDPAKSLNNPDNPALTAGFTFLGQFLDHDMTFDPTSSLARRQDPESIRNFRIPALDLDSVYGGGSRLLPPAR